MKIRNIEYFKVPPRWLFIKVTTESGIVGWGEPVVEGRADTVAAAIKEMEYCLIGKDARHIEDIWQVMYRGGFYRGGPILCSAMSGIEQALWDIKGKALGVPVYELLGGPCKSKMKVYSWIEGDNAEPDEIVRLAGIRLKQGYDAIKMVPCEGLSWIDSFKKVDKIVNKIASLREAYGYNLDIALDFHGRIHKSMAAVLMKELDKYNLLFIEEPILCENVEGFRELKKYTSTPIASGERNFTRWGFKNMITDGSVDIVQPDLSHAGGILETRKIAAMAEAFDVSVAPHCPLGPIALASCLQLDFCSPNAFIQEQSLGIHYNQGCDLLDYLKDQSVLEYKNGYVDLFTKPGLGIEIDEDKVRMMAKKGHDWRNAIWRTEDGNLAEW